VVSVTSLRPYSRFSGPDIFQCYFSNHFHYCHSINQQRIILIFYNLGILNLVTTCLVVGIKNRDNISSSGRRIKITEYYGNDGHILTTIKEEITRLSSKYSAGLNTHPNHLVTQLSNPPAFRRLRKLLSFDLPYRFTQNS
jgi:hypothetical protein